MSSAGYRTSIINASLTSSRKGPGIPGPAITYFDFAVAERPIYIPGSGPPLAPVTPMPVHDRDGIILDLIQMGEGNPRYVVGYEAKPSLRVSVKLENILNWVSARTYEDWQYERTVEQEKILEDATLSRLTAKEEKRKATLARRARMIGKGSSEESETEPEPKTGKRKRTVPVEPVGKLRKRTRIIPGMGLGMVKTAPSRPGQRRKSIIEEAPTFTSPKSMHQASLTSPNKQRGLAEVLQADTDEEDDQEDTELALQMQLNAGFASDSMDPERQYSPSTSFSQDPRNNLHSPLKSKVPAPILPPSYQRKQSSRPFKPPSFGSSGSDRSLTRHPDLGSALTGTSSREANSIYEKLERGNKSKFIKADQTISQMYTYKPQQKTSPTPQIAADDEEYEVDSVIGDEKRSVNGKIVQFYLIKWVGDWDNTWEPASLVGEDSIEQYERLKLQKKQVRKDKSRQPAKKTDSHASNDLFELGRHGKILKQRPQGTGGLGSSVDLTVDSAASSDEDTLFLSDTKRITTEQQKRSKGKSLKNQIRPRREFIEIEEESEGF